ncbi:GL18762 [Drosophila persimilis]|uniref:GL18762 n=1 Tax=Drosophila persimilis TaxID=7234 RepID=B4G8U9_DROPE|nr:GL18762 [Drosophila persimilis]
MAAETPAIFKGQKGEPGTTSEGFVGFFGGGEPQEENEEGNQEGSQEENLEGERGGEPQEENHEEMMNSTED